MSYKTEATIKLDDAQLHFLRTRYGKRWKSASRLAKAAVLEAVAAQAQHELAESELTLRAAERLRAMEDVT